MGIEETAISQMALPLPVESTNLTIRLEELFEGPLDLLLNLVRKDELDVSTIPIARVTEQYLAYLQLMKELNINLAGEWLMRAAELIYLKSRTLLPPDPTAENADAEVDEVLVQLLYDLQEHMKFKNAAEVLYSREEVENAVWNKPPTEAVDAADEVVALTLFDLLRAFHAVVQRFEEHPSIAIAQEEVTVERKIEEIQRLLVVHDTLLFSSFFTHMPSKRHLIATFLALLELVRLHEIWLYQENAFEEIRISKLKESRESADGKQ